MDSRRCIVIVDGVRVEGLRTSFRVKKTSQKHPNQCEIKITNLSSSTRMGIRKKGAQVELSAGIGEDVSLLFSGDARQVTHLKEGAEWVTKVECADGEVAFQHRWVSQAFGPGAKTIDLIRKCINAMGIDEGNAIQSATEVIAKRSKPAAFANGYVLEGRASAELDKLMRTLGLTWSIQDKSIYVFGKTEMAVFEFTPATGLVGSIEQGSDTAGRKRSNIIKPKVILVPQLRPGNVISVKSRTQRGLFRVTDVDHEGDTAAGAWYTTMEAQPESGFAYA